MACNTYTRATKPGVRRWFQGRLGDESVTAWTDVTSSPRDMPLFGSYFVSRGCIVMQSMIGQTLTQRVHPVQSVVTFGKCVVGLKSIA